jgi:hypothetical protein
MHTHVRLGRWADASDDNDKEFTSEPSLDSTGEAVHDASTSKKKLRNRAMTRDEQVRKTECHYSSPGESYHGSQALVATYPLNFSTLLLQRGSFPTEAIEEPWNWQKFARVAPDESPAGSSQYDSNATSEGTVADEPPSPSFMTSEPSSWDSLQVVVTPPTSFTTEATPHRTIQMYANGTDYTMQMYANGADYADDEAHATIQHAMQMQMHAAVASGACLDAWDGNVPEIFERVPSEELAHSDVSVAHVPQTQTRKQSMRSDAQDANLRSQQSIAASMHRVGKCKPCVFLNTSVGCKYAAGCMFCHESHARSRPRACKAKRDRIRRIVEWHLEAAESNPRQSVPGPPEGYPCLPSQEFLNRTGNSVPFVQAPQERYPLLPTQGVNSYPQPQALDPSCSGQSQRYTRDLRQDQYNRCR